MKKLNNQNIWSLEKGTQERINNPIWAFIGFHQRGRHDSQNIHNGTFCRPAVTSAQCIVGAEKYPVSDLFLNYDDDDHSQGYSESEEALRAFTKSDIRQPYISVNEFRSSNEANAIWYNLYVFDIRYQKNVEFERIEVESKISGNVPGGLYGYALVLTKWSVSVNSDGKRHFDLK